MGNLRTWLLFIIITPLFFNFPSPIYALENPCDDSVLEKPGDPLGYHLRDNRCEGRHEINVSTTMVVRSFTIFFEEYDPSSGEDLIIEWAPPLGKRGVRIRAHSLNPDIRYQMDVIRPSNSLFYHWPPKFLSSLGIYRDELGVIAMTRYSLGGKDRDLYIPLQIRQQSASVRSAVFRVVLVSGKEMSEVFVSLAHVDTSGNLSKFIYKKEPIGYLFYPAEHPIEFSLPEVRQPGVYLLVIRAVLKSGGMADPIELLFHSPGL